MEKEIYHNLDKIVKIEIAPETKSWFYKYSKGIKFLGITIKREGIYYPLGGFIKEMPAGHFLKDNAVYEKPRIIIYFTDRSTHTLVFDTIEGAKEFFDNLSYFNDLNSKLKRLKW